MKRGIALAKRWLAVCSMRFIGARHSCKLTFGRGHLVLRDRLLPNTAASDGLIEIARSRVRTWR